jgi:Zn-dependent protease/predicted transcriptional regulator
MRWSLRIGSIAGIRIEIHVTFLLYVGWIAVDRGLLSQHPAHALVSVALILLVFGCVLLHELGHALAARRYGIRTRDIILLPIGGIARLERMPDKPAQEIVVALAGPAVNVVIAALLWLMLGGVRSPDAFRPLEGGLLDSLLTVNILMVAFNLVPAFPMDGGRVLRAALALKLPYVQATRIAAIIGQGIALLFGVVGFFYNPALMFVALFVFLAAGEEHALVRSRATLSGVPVRDAMISEFQVLDVSDSLQRAVDQLMAGAQQDFPVLAGSELAGLLTRAELLTALQKAGPETTVGDVVARDGQVAEPGEPLEEVLRRMREHRRSAMPVVSGGRLVGMVTLEHVSELLLVREALRKAARPAAS